MIGITFFVWVYNELALQFAAEFGRSITDQDISADEIKYLLKAAET